MRGMRRLFFTMLVTLNIATVAAAATRYQVEPQASELQFLFWEDGIQLTDDVQEKSIVRLVSVADELPSKPSTFRIYVFNLSDNTIAFGPEDVMIELPDGTAISMVSPNEIDARLRRDIKRRQALATLGNALSAQSANGQTSGSFQHSGMTSDGTMFSGSGTYSGYDPALAQQQQQAVQAQVQRTDAAIQARKTEGTRALASLIRRSSINSGDVMGGIVAFEAPAAFKKLASKGTIKIAVKVGDTVHRFEAKVTKAH